ncbi:MAG: THUMP domain-containing protein [Hydrogenophaga sp.]|nr:THUMP domain-containing protein [Hydrogenophaga sp.]
MNQIPLFLPCAAGVEDFLAAEVQRITGAVETQRSRGGVSLEGSWRDAMKLNLHSRLAQRVLVRLWHGPYRNEQDLYTAAAEVAWEIWFTPRQTIKVELTAQHSPLPSLNFAALKVKDAVCDRFRDKRGERPSVDTARPDVRLFAHVTTDTLTLYIDTTGEPLFKRGWREDKGDAPLKETLAAAMIAATGWDVQAREAATLADVVPLVDPCCGSGTVCIEAAQIALHIAPGGQRRFAFEKLLPYQPHVWYALHDEARQAERPWPEGQGPIVFGSDVAFRMVDFSQRNAERAHVGQAIEFRGGDALQRLPPTPRPGVLLLNPPYGERIAAAGVAGRNAAERARTHTIGREEARSDDGFAADAFFERLAAHWKSHYAGWTAWLLTPDLKLPGRMRLKESRRVPLWNGPIECRLFRFDLTARNPRPAATEA